MSAKADRCLVRNWTYKAYLPTVRRTGKEEALSPCFLLPELPPNGKCERLSSRRSRRWARLLPPSHEQRLREHRTPGEVYYGVPLERTVPSPPTFAFSWLSGLLLYGTPNDDGRAARGTWTLSHPDLRLTAALSGGVGVDEASVAELVKDAEIGGKTWDRFAPGLVAYLRGLLPDWLDPGYPLTALRHSFPESLDRQMVVLVPGVRGELPPPATAPFGLTVERHRRGWRIVSVQREWEMPEWFAQADAELPVRHDA